MSLYRTNVPLSVKGDRVAKGEEIELTGEEAAPFDEADLTLLSSAPVSEPEPEAPALSLEEMSHTQLKERAKELGLSQAGSKADLQERITLHLTSDVSAQGYQAGFGAEREDVDEMVAENEEREEEITT